MLSGPYCDFNRYLIKESDQNKHFEADMSKAFLNELASSLKEFSEGVYKPKITSVGKIVLNTIRFLILSRSFLEVEHLRWQMYLQDITWQIAYLTNHISQTYFMRSLII